MIFKFWGVRGSIPIPNRDMLLYGGNTTCIEVRGENTELIILDAGTGIFQLGQELMSRDMSDLNIFITHTHWDHIQGLPMFQPCFSPRYKINIYGARDPISGLGIKERLEKQMDRHFFPLQIDELNAKLTFNDFEEGSEVQIGSLKITGFQFNHSAINLGYRIEDSHNSLVFTGDHEWMFNSLEPENEDWESLQTYVTDRTSQTLNFMKDSDVLIIDSTYTTKEYETKQGWGHGTYCSSILAGRDAGIKTVYMTHHEPTRTDVMLENVFRQSLETNRVSKDDPKFYLAKEGEEIRIK